MRLEKLVSDVCALDAVYRCTSNPAYPGCDASVVQVVLIGRTRYLACTVTAGSVLHVTGICLPFCNMEYSDGEVRRGRRQLSEAIIMWS